MDIGAGGPSQIAVPISTSFAWTVRRWSLRHLWYRGRLRLRRMKRRENGAAAAQRYEKDPAVQFSDGVSVVFADLSGDNGLSRAAIYDLVEIRKRHAHVVTIDIRDAISGRKLDSPIYTDLVSNAYFLCQPDMYERVLPLIAPEAMAGAYRVGRWVWETPKFPRAWNFASSLIHEVWAASEFSAEVFRRGVGIPVRVVMHAVQPPPPSSVNIRAQWGIDQKTFLGLAIMDIRSCPERKNPWGHVLAWKAAFGNNRDALLILKVRTSKRTRLVRQELRELIGEADNIRLMDTQLSEAELSSLQRSCDVFLSLHRSEGYGLNIHEALLCGKPVVATHWSANVEYGPQYPGYHAVRHQPIKYRDWTGHYEDKEFFWANPDIAHAADLLSDIYVRTQEAKLTNEF